MEPKKKRLTKYNYYALLLIAPFIIFVFVMCYVPLLGWSMSFMKYRPGVPWSKQEFVGLYHYIRIFTVNKDFYIALRNTLVMSGLSILTAPLAIVLAILINECRSQKFGRVIQSVSALPNFVSWILVYAVAFAFFSVDDGVVNTVFYKMLHIFKEPSNVLANADIAWITQILLGIWKGVGWSAIIYLATIAGIDQELYEAAKVDGAGRMRRIWHITLPGVRETFFVLLLLQIANILSVGFEQYYVFQNPMTVSRLEVLDTYIYKQAMSGGLKFDYSTAISVLKTTVSVTLLFGINKLSKIFRGVSLF